VSRLQDKDAGSQTCESLMKAVLVCDKFLTGAQGTQAELEVLKSQVKLTLAKQVSLFTFEAYASLLLAVSCCCVGNHLPAGMASSTWSNAACM
jgi:hypothetical protein